MISVKERNALYILFIVVIIFRLLWIDSKNLWFDEIYSLNLSSDSFVSLIQRTASDIHPPLYYLVLKLWITFSGDSAFAVRLLSVLFSSLSVFYIYSLSRNFLDRNSSLMVIIFYAISPLNIYYSQEARMAAMNLFLNAGAVYYLVSIIKNVNNGDSNIKYYTLYLIFLVSALYTHYISFLMLIAHVVIILLYFRLDAKKYSDFIKIYLIALVLYIPWLNIMIRQVTKGQPWRTPQTLHQVLSEVINYIKDLNLGLYYHYSDYNLVKLITLYLLFIYLFTVLLALIKKKSGDIKINITLIIVPVIISCIILLRQKIEFYRYLSILVPYILIHMVYSFNILRKYYIYYPVLIITLSVNIYGTVLNYRFNFKNNDYREIVNHINYNYKEGDRIYVEPHYYRWIAEYYFREYDRNLKPAEINYGFYEILDSIKTQIPARFWLILDYGVQDTLFYGNYIKSLNKNYVRDKVNTYNLAPRKAELYLFIKKSGSDDPLLQNMQRE